MGEWDEVKKAVEFAGRLNPITASREYADVTAKALPSIKEYGVRAAEAKRTVEGAKGELAQMASSGASRSDELLNVGISGLGFFDAFLPLYNDWTKAGLDLERDIYGQYRKFFGIDFGAFRHDVGTVQGSYSAMQNTYAEVDSEFRALVETWSGDAAVAATNHISKFLEAGHAFQEGVNTFGRNVEHHVSAMESIIRLCAQSALELFSVDCAGQVPPTVQQHIKMARHQSGVAMYDAVGAVTDGFGDIVKGAASYVPVVGEYADGAVDMLTEAANLAKKLLDEKFVPAFESKLTKFNEIVCAKTEEDLRSLWDEFIGAAECVPDNPFADVPPLFST
ncbi:WXG100 family type VII secretion target [Saccharopolyspora spinosa]|uniref:Uncharacterized protein YukE n=1 Tax=Saccharopolyspora spinosa TaxID=60894 RepID=A0A2N3XZ57_SACSN|nr:hypothetical protein [Saccharopolyspora spinosa]PKW15909.1 uncharacterized protein YukE [Saccharopolyspora spinosa]